MNLPVVSAINIYPIKSCAGISVSRAEIEERGFRHDRRWMIVGSDSTFVSQRSAPRLSLVRVQIDQETLKITAPGMNALQLPLQLSGPQRVNAVVWNDTVEAIPAGAEARDWFSRFLGFVATPVFFPDAAIRNANPSFAPQPAPIGFADAFPFLLISEASLEDLNSRLPSPVPMNRFRPNIVVRGCPPYAEDSWTEMTIGAIRFRAVKPCSRCATTTVDQATAETGKEPLRTLALYRGRNGKVYFGQNLVHFGTGALRVGDTVTT